MNYIVLDLEWNQGEKTAEETTGLLFEIIEIGAIKMNEEFKMIGEFSEIVKPQVYHEMHHVTSKLIHMQMEELERGKPFDEVCKRFLEWCGEDEYIFCTWGSLDLLELQRNMKYYQMKPIADKPFAFLDIQKLFALGLEEPKERRSLEYGIDFLKIVKDIPFHRAFSDAYYTAKILMEIADQAPEVLKKVSFDVYCPPRKREDEIKIEFDTYFKYISRVFESKLEAFADREVASSKCYICHKNLRKKVKWFTPNGKHFYCVAYCDKHGFIKYKSRVKKAEDGGIYVVKTSKFIDQIAVDDIISRKKHATLVKGKRKDTE